MCIRDSFPTYGWVDRLDTYLDYNGYWLTPIIASRGCYWSRCRFCAERFSWRKRAPGPVVDELQWLMERGAAAYPGASVAGGSATDRLDIVTSCNAVPYSGQTKSYEVTRAGQKEGEIP